MINKMEVLTMTMMTQRKSLLQSNKPRKRKLFLKKRLKHSKRK